MDLPDLNAEVGLQGGLIQPKSVAASCVAKRRIAEQGERYTIPGAEGRCSTANFTPSLVLLLIEFNPDLPIPGTTRTTEPRRSGQQLL